MMTLLTISPLIFPFYLPERGVADHTLSLVSNKTFETVGGSAVVQRSCQQGLGGVVLQFFTMSCNTGLIQY
jgi:hypothetical protein